MKIIGQNDGLNSDLARQMEFFLEIIKGNKILYEVIKQTSSLGLSNHYIGAGCLAQTVWNYLCELPPGHGISDIDIVYFDTTDKDGSGEARLREKCQTMFQHIPYEIDLVNQARVHLWYEKEFGFPIEPYQSTEQAINTWPTTASSIGLRVTMGDVATIYAPYGLNDLFGLVVRANKVQITKEIYEVKVAKWTKKWSDLTIVPWEG